MAGIALLLACSVGVVAVIALVNLIQVANEDHERNGLFGVELHQHHLDMVGLADSLAHGRERDELVSLAELVAVLDRVVFSGTPLKSCERTDDGAWALVFHDGTTVLARVANPRAMVRAQRLAAKESVVVSRVQPSGAVAVVELGSPRHPPLRVALTA